MENCNSKTFIVGKDQLSSFTEGEKKCYLLANGLGGYSSLTALGSVARRDHALFISSKKAPNYRIHMVTNVEEEVSFINENKKIPLYNQQFATRTSNIFSGSFLNSFTFKYYPSWSYKVEDLEIVKEIVYVYNENTVCVHYKVYNPTNEKHILSVTPLYRLTLKDDFPQYNDEIEKKDCYIFNKSTNNKCFFLSNGNNTFLHTSPFYNDMFFEYDSRDGRECIGKSFKANTFSFNIEKCEEDFYIIFSDKEVSLKIKNKSFESIEEYGSSLFKNEEE